MYLGGAEEGAFFSVGRDGSGDDMLAWVGLLGASLEVGPLLQRLADQKRVIDECPRLLEWSRYDRREE
jgi:hypothetical protein